MLRARTLSPLFLYAVFAAPLSCGDEVSPEVSSLKDAGTGATGSGGTGSGATVGGSPGDNPDTGAADSGASGGTAGTSAAITDASDAAAVDSTTVDTGPTQVVDLGLSDTATICDGTGCPQLFGSCPYTFGELTIGGVCEEIMDCAYCNNGQAAGWKISCTGDHVWTAVEYCD